LAGVHFLRATGGWGTVISGFRRLSRSWRNFWFSPQETSSLALFRIAFGLITALWTLTLGPNLFAFLGASGILPDPPPGYPGEWGVLTGSSGSAVLVAVWATTFFGAVALTVGWRTRLAASVVFVGVVSLQHRNWLILNSGDGLIRNLAFYCALAPSGTALSLDRWRIAPDRFWEFPVRAPWALRLIQIQLSVVYLSAVWHKVQGELWRNGTAVSYALRVTDVHRFPVPAFLTQSVELTELLTFGTLALELALAVLVWNRAARPWVLTMGASMHIMIDYSILVGFFSLAMLATYLTFISPETASRFILAGRDRCRWPRLPCSTGPAPPGGET